MTATTATVGGTPYATSASYNDAGQLLSQTYPNGDTLTSSYDPLSGWQQQESLTLAGQSTALPLLTAEAYSGAAGGARPADQRDAGGLRGADQRRQRLLRRQLRRAGAAHQRQRQLHPQRRGERHAL